MNGLHDFYRFVQWKKNATIFIVCGASYFGYCIKNVLMQSTIESSLHRLKWFICVYVYECALFQAVLKECWIFFYEFLVMALLKHKRQTINNKINTWTVPWWSAVVKFWTKKIGQSIKNLFCVAVVSLPVFFFHWFMIHHIHATIRLECNGILTIFTKYINLVVVELIWLEMSLRFKISCYARSHGVRSVVFFFARQK